MWHLLILTSLYSDESRLSHRNKKSSWCLAGFVLVIEEYLIFYLGI